jgi:hypothetical protein
VKLTRTPEAILDALARWINAARQSELGPLDLNLVQSLCPLLDGYEASVSGKRDKSGQPLITFRVPAGPRWPESVRDRPPVYAAMEYVSDLTQALWDTDRPADNKKALLVAEELFAALNGLIDEGWDDHVFDLIISPIERGVPIPPPSPEDLQEEGRQVLLDRWRDPSSGSLQ